MSDHTVNLTRLRERAEAAMAAAALKRSAPLTPEGADPIRVVEELRIYQAELEIQNQDLALAQRQTAAALDKYKRLFDFLPLPGFIVDGQGFIVEANANARDRFDLRPLAALQRRSVHQLFQPASRALLHAVFSSGKESARGLFTLEGDRRSAPVDAQIIPIDEVVDFGGMKLMVLVDRGAEHDLREINGVLARSEERYRALFDRSKVPMLLIDPVDGSIRGSNAAAQHFYGHSEERLLAAPVADIECRPEDAGASAHGPVQRVHRLASGETRDVEIWSGPLEVDGQSFLHCIIHDVTERRQMEMQLRIERTRLKNVINGTRVGTWEWRVPTGEIVLNERWAGIVGYTLAELAPVSIATWERLTVSDDLERAGELLQRHFAGELPLYECEIRMRHKDGSLVWVLDRGQVIERAGDGRPLLMAGTHQDISERKQAEEQLRLAASVFTEAREGIVITDPEGTILQVNSAFSRITGYSCGDVLGRNPSLLHSGRQDRAFYAAMWDRLVQNGHWHGELWNRRKDGTLFAELLSISAVRDKAMTHHYVGLIADITAQKEHERQLERIAHYDPLTGLPNRLLLADRLHQAMISAQRRSQRLAVAYIDLDGFKAINDTHGHEVGDQLLIAIAARMKKTLREGDTITRLGGDEFVAVLIDLTEPDASLPVLSRLLAAASDPVRIGDLTLKVTASLGLTFYPQAENVDADQLLRQADQAMYQAKLAGKARYHLFDPEQDRSLRGHNEGIERIRRALAQGELVLHYQPKVNMRTGAVVGAEALIRWRHPDRGLLLPAAFLPLIEDHPLAVEIGEWVVASALAQLAEWRMAGFNLAVSVNVSPRQLQQADFTARLTGLLAAHPDVDPRRLELEVLESSALQEMEQVSARMYECRGVGVSFSLDDFGTGYSSLSYLKRLPVQQLKIDRSFVRDILDDPEDLAIIEGIMDLAGAFGRAVIAEGVETVEHGEILMLFGCEMAQGYAIARPMPAAELPGWTAGWAPNPRWQRCRPLNRAGLPLLFACAQHRAWTRGVEAYLAKERDLPPPPGVHCSRLADWLARDGRTLAIDAGISRRIGVLHGKAHDLAHELVRLIALDEPAQVRRRMVELRTLNDSLTRAIKAAIRTLLETKPPGHDDAHGVSSSR